VKIIVNQYAKAFMLAASFSLVNAAHAQLEELPVGGSFTDPEGKMVGNLNLQASASLGGMVTNNVLQDSSHLSAEGSELSLSSSLTSQSDKHLIVGSLDLLSRNIVDDAFSELDVDLHMGTVFGRFETSEHTNIRLLLIDQETILGVSAEDQVLGLGAGLEEMSHIEAIFEVGNAKYFANVMARYVDLETISLQDTIVGFEEESLDRVEEDLIFLFGRHFSWGKTFLFGGQQSVEYSATAGAGFEARNSDELRYGAGFEAELNDFTADANIYRFTQKFDNILIEDIERKWVGGAKISYAMDDRLDFLISVDRDFTETNIEGSGGLFIDNYFAGAMIDLPPKAYLKIGPSYSKTSIAGSKIGIRTKSIDLEAAWKFSDKAVLQLNTSISIQNVNVSMLAGLNAQTALSTLSFKYSL
tara:strand:- start:1932 stop:3176 length:1245 start_codon:yes stop_codon:yes gene_type:complete